MTTLMPQGPETAGLRPQLGTLIKRLSHLAARVTTSALQPSGLNPAQHAALRHIRTTGGCSAAALARLCAVSPQSMGLLLTTLEREGLITRTPSAVHPRVLEIRLSRAGARTLRSADRSLEAALDAFVEILGPAHAEALQAGLDRAVTALTRP
ncbi:DNA-binding MarR family transcriptional regulator [Streptacidiphilus sp. MAP12-33]|uniref:MarR family winged helix-turn-helix transcriptional regulator n=1 Tax=Streptacidiphilus sp. MAP12-33 TaxID=3156266 RepID=UPI00351172DB